MNWGGGVGCGINMVGVAGRVKMLETEKCFYSCKMGEEGGGGGEGVKGGIEERGEEKGPSTTIGYIFRTFIS